MVPSLSENYPLATVWSKVAPGCRSREEDGPKIGDALPTLRQYGFSWGQVGCLMCQLRAKFALTWGHTCPQDGQFERLWVPFCIISGEVLHRAWRTKNQKNGGFFDGFLHSWGVRKGGWGILGTVLEDVGSKKVVFDGCWGHLVTFGTDPWKSKISSFRPVWDMACQDDH